MYDKSNSQNNQDFTTTNSKKKSNPYKISKGYVANPYDFLYQDYDVEISDRDDIVTLQNRAIELEEKIEGDFDLDEMTHLIRVNSLAFVEIGLIAFKIRAMRLYKEKYDNFTDYCHIELGRSRSYIDRLIKASAVVLELIRNGFSVLPKNESQARLLSYFTGSELIWRWKAIVETIPPHKITAQSISIFLNGTEETVEPESEFIQLPRYLSDHISRYALAIGMTLQDFVVMLLEQIFKPAKPKTNWRDFEREYEWQSDLEKLIEEGENFLNST